MFRLPAVEVVVVQTIVRLSAQNGSFPWKLVNVPPFDALLVDGNLIEDRLAEVEQMAPAVLTVARMHSEGMANTLERPIRAEKLQQWLLNTGQELLEARRSPGPAALVSAMSQELLDSARFSLRRWPPAALMGRSEDDDRMANLLWRRQLSASELADRCGQSVSRCMRFLQALRNAGVLEVHASLSAGNSRHPPF
ncbi:winged helix-turn-helix transcriptional regulator [Variovorax sp. LT1R20]